MKGPALKIVKTSAKFCCHLYSRGCEAERQLAVGGGSRHGAQPWAAAAAARRTAAAAAAASRSRRGCVRGGGRHHHPATTTQPRHPVVDLRTSVGARPGTPPVLPLSTTAGCLSPRRAARPSPAAATAPQYVKICARLVIFGHECSVH